MKRKHQELNISKKFEIIQEVEKNNQTKSESATLYNIPLSTLSTILKNSQKIKHLVDNGNEVRKRKRIRTSRYPAIESELFEWFCKARANNIPITGPLM